jgi:hypothetical protein
MIGAPEVSSTQDRRNAGEGPQREGALADETAEGRSWFLDWAERRAAPMARSWRNNAGVRLELPAHRSSSTARLVR